MRCRALAALLLAAVPCAYADESRAPLGENDPVLIAATRAVEASQDRMLPLAYAIRLAEAEQRADDPRIQALRDSLSREETRARTLVADEVRLRLLGRPSPEAALGSLLEAADREVGRIRHQLVQAFQAAAQRESTEEREREAARWYVELASAQTRADLLHQALTALSPLGDGRRSQTVLRLAELAQEIGGLDPANPVVVGADRRVAGAALRMRQDVAWRAYRRLAAHGLVADPTTGQPVFGPLRKRIARNAELNLAEQLRAESERTPLGELLHWDDSRPEFASDIEDAAARNPEYVLVTALSQGVAPTREEFFLAAARVIRTEQELVDTWFRDDFLGGSWHDTGLGKLLRANNVGWTDDADVARVRNRIARFRQESDTAAETLEAAARTPAADLAGDQLALLRAFGFVVGTEGADLRYEIPESSGDFATGVRGMRAGLRLPGASWLDVIDLENIGWAVVTCVVPELAAARAAAWAEAATSSQQALLAIRAMASLGTGFAADAAREAIETGSVDWERLVLETAVLGGALQAAGAVTEGAAAAVMKRVARTERGTPLHGWLKRTENRAQAERWLANALSLTSEGALAAFYEAQVEGDADVEAFLACLVQAGVARIIAHNWEHYTQVQTREVRDAAPEWLRPMLDDAEFAERVRTQVQRRLDREAGAHERLGSIAAQEGLTSPERVFQALLRGEISWRDLKLLYYKSPQALQPLMAEVKDRRDTHYQLSGRLVLHICRETLDRQFARERTRLTVQGATEAEFAALEQWRNRELDLINQGLIQPGSGDPTSDIDRSTLSRWLRRHLRAHHRILARAADGHAVPTSAKAFDVNEYINVFPHIESSRPFQKAMRKIELDDGVTHGDRMRARTLAGALRNATSTQRSIYLTSVTRQHRDRTKDLPPGERAARDRAHDWTLREARRSLEESEFFLHKAAEEVATRLGMPVDHPDVAILAKDRLYDQRFERIDDMLARLETLDDGPEALRLRADIDAAMSTALRDGIETYCSPVGLDIIVKQVQMETRADGEKMKVRDRLVDPEFTVEGKLAAHYEAEHIDGFVDDQMMFIFEHVNGYLSGHETALESGRALGKYLERLYLARAVRGDIEISQLRQLPPADPQRKLLETCQAMAAAKSDPDALGDVLRGLVPTPPKSAEAGMYVLFRLMDASIPGMRGSTGSQVLERGTAPNPALWIRRRLRVVKDSQWEASRRVLSEVAGSASVAAALSELIQRYRGELTQCRAATEALAQLATQFGERDWPQARRLLQELREKRLLRASLPWPSQKSEIRRRLDAEIEALKAQLDAMRERADAVGAEQLYVQVPEYARLVDRAEILRTWLDAHAGQREIARVDAVREARLDAVALAGSWRIGEEPSPVARIFATENGRILRMRVTWLGREGEGAHFEIEAEHHRDRLRGLWREIPATEPGGVPRTSPTATGLFEARLEGEGDVIRVVDPTYNDPRIDVDWTGRVLVRPDEPGVAAAAYLRAHHAPIPQRTRERDLRVVTELKGSNGFLAVLTIDPDGSKRVLDYEVTRAGDPDDLTASGRTWEGDEVAPGRYDVYVSRWADRPVATVTVTPGAIERVALHLGRVRLSIRGPGDEVVQVPGVLAYAGHEPVRTRSGVSGHGDRLLALLPGDYRLVFSVGGVRQSTSVRVSSGTETRVEGRVGTLIAHLRGPAGSRDDPIEIYHADEAVRTQAPGTKIHLPPGAYRLLVSGGVFPILRDVVVSSGVIQDLDLRWSVIRFPDAPRMTRIEVRRTLGPDSWSPWRPIDGGLVEVRVPRGRYELRWREGDESHTKTIELFGGDAHELKPDK